MLTTLQKFRLQKLQRQAKALRTGRVAGKSYASCSPPSPFFSIHLPKTDAPQASVRIPALLRHLDAYSLRLGLAVIADEAHRSHGSSTTELVHEVLSGSGKQPAWLTYIGFTATPSPMALQLFGVEERIQGALLHASMPGFAGPALLVPVLRRICPQRFPSPALWSPCHLLLHFLPVHSPLLIRIVTTTFCFLFPCAALSMAMHSCGR